MKFTDLIYFVASKRMWSAIGCAFIVDHFIEFCITVILFDSAVSLVNFLRTLQIMFVGYFAFHVTISLTLAIIGPISICHINTKYCSTQPPPPIKGKGPLPRITVQVSAQKTYYLLFRVSLRHSFMRAFYRSYTRDLRFVGFQYVIPSRYLVVTFFILLCLTQSCVADLIKLMMSINSGRSFLCTRNLLT